MRRRHRPTLFSSLQRCRPTLLSSPRRRIPSRLSTDLTSVAKMRRPPQFFDDPCLPSATEERDHGSRGEEKRRSCWCHALDVLIHRMAGYYIGGYQGMEGSCIKDQVLMNHAGHLSHSCAAGWTIVELNFAASTELLRHGLPDPPLCIATAKRSTDCNINYNESPILLRSYSCFGWVL